MRYDFMAGARIVPQNRTLDRKEKREEEPLLCTDVRESGDWLKRSGGGGDGRGSIDLGWTPRGNARLSMQQSTHQKLTAR